MPNKNILIANASDDKDLNQLQLLKNPNDNEAKMPCLHCVTTNPIHN